MIFNNYSSSDNEPLSKKTVFDERQKAMQYRFGIEAFGIFAALTLICCLTLDFLYKWAESTAFAVLLLATLSLVWYLGRCAASGCLAAAIGRRTQRFSMTLITIGTVLQSVRFFSKLGDEDFIVKDGMLTIDFLLFACLMVEFGCGIFSLFVIRREERINESEGKEK